MSKSNSPNSSPDSTAAKGGTNLNSGHFSGSPGSKGTTGTAPGGSAGGGTPGGTASGSTSQPSVTFVHGKDAKMLTGKKKPTHESIQVVYDSFRTLKFQDPTLLHVRQMERAMQAFMLC